MQTGSSSCRTRSRWRSWRRSSRSPPRRRTCAASCARACCSASPTGSTRLAESRPDQRHLVAAVGYVFTPVVPIVVLLSQPMKHEPMLRRHAAQALLWAVPFLVLLVLFCVAAILLLRSTLLALCLLPFLFLVP